MAKKQPQDKHDRYFQLHHYMLKTDAWKWLSAAARAVYIQIGSRYNGANNGRLACSVRDAASECGIANNTANRCFKELVDLGFIVETRHGSLSRKTRTASEWRLTAFRCDLTETIASRLFMQRGALAREHRLARSRPNAADIHPKRRPVMSPSPVSNDDTACLKRRSPVSQTTIQPVSNDDTVGSPSVSNDDTLKPVLGGSPVSNDDTHIIYQVGSSPKTGASVDQDGPASAAPPPTDKPKPKWKQIADELGLGRRAGQHDAAKKRAVR